MSETPNKVIYSMIGVNKFHNKKQVLKDIYLSYFYGAKIGVIGLNGSGKSSLLRILAGVDKEFIGETVLSAGFTVGFLEQEPQLDNTKTVREIVEQGVQETVDLLKEYDKINEKFAEPMSDDEMTALLERQGEVQNKLEALGAWDLDSRLEMAMDALRCPSGDTPVKIISGGERRRVALCRLLLKQPDILLLDEPTNHLDMRAKDVLLKALTDYNGTVVFVSHDRYFIDKLATRVLEVGDGRVEVYPGNYEDYRWRKEGGAAALQKAVSSPAHLQPANGNVNGQPPKSEDSAGKRLNPIKRKQMEDRVHELESDINRLEDTIAECEAALLSFVSAEETQRVMQELEMRRAELQGRLAEWEELGQALQA